MLDAKKIIPIEILMVEDNIGDIRLMKEALKDARVLNHVTTVGDGMGAIELLRQKGAYADAKRPDLILLDLNLPKKNGQEVLEEIKQDPSLKRIPVVIVTSSEAEKDIAQTYDSYANCYIVKPVDLNQFVKVVRSIENFWLTIVKLPPEEI
jgi:CheY-like chemotaxis protein